MTGSLADYLVITAPELPRIDWISSTRRPAQIPWVYGASEKAA